MMLCLSSSVWPLIVSQCLSICELRNLPSASWGSFGAGSQRRDCSEMSVDLSVRTGDQASLRISRQIAP